MLLSFPHLILIPEYFSVKQFFSLSSFLWVIIPAAVPLSLGVGDAAATWFRNLDNSSSILTILAIVIYVCAHVDKDL